VNSIGSNGYEVDIIFVNVDIGPNGYKVDLDKKKLSILIFFLIPIFLAFVLQITEHQRSSMVPSSLMNSSNRN